MTLLDAKTEAVSGTRGARRATRVWGLLPTDLHDRYWGAMGVQVVRLGGPGPHAKGPKLYLLLDAEDLVSFEIAPLVARLNWVKPGAMRVRILDSDAEAYVERVIADGDGRFLSIRRTYRAATRSTLRVTLTPDPRLAALWAGASDPLACWREIRRSVGRGRSCVDKVAGRVLSARDPGECRQFLDQLVSRWKDAGSVLDGVYQFQRGVWFHESAAVDPGARLVAPLWIGAGVRVDAGDVLVGPEIIPDAPVASPDVRPLSWDTAYYPGWRLMPRLRLRRLRRVSKRMFDIAFSLAVLGATAPLYPIIILLIALEDGWPAFFAHTRQTLRGAEFPCLKFRTMCKDAERLKAELAGVNLCDGPQFYMKNDPRLLRIGRVLRRCQLDELPQFVNVLLGHMSVVGPRPSPDKENQYCPAWREARLSVRPGVTGLWQVRRTREPETDFQEWIRYDLEYVQHESWRLDLWIIWETVRKVIAG